MITKRILTITFSSLFAIIPFQVSATNTNVAKNRIYNTHQTQTESSTTQKTTNNTTENTSTNSTSLYNTNNEKTVTTATTAEQTKASKEQDNKTTNAVKAKIREDHLLSGSKIDVTTNNGVVTLTGKLKTEQEASKAIENANSVDGVRDVDTSKLIIESSTQPFADTVITAKVKGAFIREKLFGKEPIEVTSITVETTNGVVYLIGVAESQEIVRNAEKLAKSVSGVKKVDNKLEVNKNKDNTTKNNNTMNSNGNHKGNKKK